MLFSSVVKGETESLYVDGFDVSDVGWVSVGVTPFIYDSDGDYVYSSLQNQLMDWFSFAGSGESGSVNSVVLYVEVKQDSKGDDQVKCSLRASGLLETVVGVVTPSDVDYGWETIDVSGWLLGWSEINSCELKLASVKVGPKFAVQYVRRCYLLVDFSGGAMFVREPVCNVDCSSNIIQGFSCVRTLSLNVDWIGGLLNNVFYVRTVNAGLVFAADVFSGLIFGRVVSLTVNWVSNVMGELLSVGQLFIREVALTVNWLGNVFGQLGGLAEMFIRDVGLNVQFLVKVFVPFGLPSVYDYALVYCAVVLFFVAVAVVIVMGDSDSDD